ncbi:MAG: YciI family protein [Aquabacterium sp.]
MAQDIRYVVFHRPGPAWVAGKSPFEQPGMREHVEHFRQLHAEGKLTLGGPHMDGAGGGMMIPEPGMTQDEVTAFAAADPAVKSGLLMFQVRPWMIGMRKA